MCSLHDIAEILLKLVLNSNQSINQSINQHIYGILKIENSSHTCFKRNILLYDRGDYAKFREKLQNVNWDDILNPDDN